MTDGIKWQRHFFNTDLQHGEIPKDWGKVIVGPM